MMRVRPEFPNEEHINFATVTESGETEVIPVSPITLAARVNQDFVWTEDVLVVESNSVSCYLLKLSLPLHPDSSFDLGYIKNLMRNMFGKNLFGKVIILYGNQVHFAELSNTGSASMTAFRETVSKSIMQQLSAQFAKLKPDVYQLADSNTLKILTSLLGSYLDEHLMNDSISLSQMEEKFRQVKDAHKKLAVAKINDVVGYGVIVLEDIPANTAVTFYAGVLGQASQRDKQDDYAIGGKLWGVSAKRHRNFAGFITHAFEKKSSSSQTDYDRVYLDDFIHHDENNSNWHANLLSANVFEKTVVFDHKPYTFLESREIIRRGSILAVDYGLAYWRSRKIAPAILTLKGEIVDPASYVCSHNYYIRAFTPVRQLVEERTPSSTRSLGLFSRCRSRQKTGVIDSYERCRCTIL